MTSLYEIARDFRADADKLADLDLDPQTLIDTIEGMSGDLETKAQNTLFVARNLESTGEAIEAAAATMLARAKAIKARAAALKKGIFDAMIFTGVTKIEGPYFKLTIQNNPPSVDAFEPGLVPERFWAQPETPPKALDKKAIAKALKAEEDVPGARLVQGQSLRVS